ncbi:MAG: CopD family protein, partial [Sulfurimonas sp.]
MYEWILWFHVISFISWFAALFYLPRLFVYHAEHIENTTHELARLETQSPDNTQYVPPGLVAVAPNNSAQTTAG